MMKWLLLSALALAAQHLGVLSYTVPQGSPGFYHGNSSAAVTFDAHSMFLDNKRLFVFSGEFHPWRAPSGKAIWRDVFEKMKAAGFNTASIYFHWGLSSAKEGGALDFNFFRSHTDLYEVAKEVGILIISRPGPYINAETTAGGFPGWLTNVPALARTNQTGFTNAWMPYIKAVAKFIEPFQYPNGPVIAVQSENEFFQSFPDNPGRAEYMQLIEDTYRANGITKIPITHNDAHPQGAYAGPGLGAVDLYCWDEYPNGFDCSHPTVWGQVDTQLNADHQKIDPDVMWSAAEFQGGSFDPWGGPGYDSCYQLLNEQFANVYYKNNYAAQVTLQSLYMTYGGTNWGNLAEPTVYTSYDYGAPIREDRTLSPKFNEIKLQSHFLHASTDFVLSTMTSADTSLSDKGQVFTTALSSPSGVGFYVVRQNDNAITTRTDFQLKMNTTAGVVTVPQFGGTNSLEGRESKIFVTNYPFGSNKLAYSTAEVMTWTTIDKTDIVVLYALAGHTIEASIPTTAQKVTVSGSTSVTAKVSNGSVVINGSPSGASVITFGSAKVVVFDKATALAWWNPRLAGTGKTPYDVAPDVPSVLVGGPYFVRSATQHGSVLALTGDLNATTTLDVIASSSVKSITWNGKTLSVSKSAFGSIRATLPFGVKAPTVPSLKDATWLCEDSLPEIKDGFDDSSWVTANKTSTPRPQQPTGGKFVLYADEYGFHYGNTIARGHFTGNATGVKLNVQGGFNFGYSVWLNNKFLGSNQGTNANAANGGLDQTNDTWTFNTADVRPGDNVVTVVVDTTGLNEDQGGDDFFKTPRGVRGYQLLGGPDFSVWKIQGNLGGENGPDNTRGPLNEGGLFFERQGAHLPGFPATNWASSKTDSTCSPTVGITTAGIKAYRTTFNLNFPANSDIPIALKFTRTPTSSYRTIIYINGWQFGRFSSKDGPQTLFPLPEGILNHQGENELLVTIWSLDAQGAKIADIGLVNTATIDSGKPPVGAVSSPGFAQLRR
ncbi:glycoside hydrolase family 35 protein [Rickenella mellea]|uniref:beta-galactosidase n=1 Tax=Rickenella mellea TaxID=50990 RepID=A0A4Y7Q8A0_9AGAM|nr:glycoside hydrolase family 35 protein [Rickenella mellea]